MQQKSNIKQQGEEYLGNMHKAQAEEKLGLEREAEARRAKLQKEYGLSDKRIKSFAKAAGLKSTFTLGGDRLLMTSFGKGNTAVAEKEIKGENIASVNEPQAFSVTLAPEGNVFVINGQIRTEASADDPRKSLRPAGEDIIHNRAQLERKYFGCNYEDNIHIQLIYNILDVDKILTGHLNNILYTINNLSRISGENHEDVLGYVYGVDKDFDEFMNPELYYKGKKPEQRERVVKALQELIFSPRMGYFGDIIYNEPLIKEVKQKKQGEDIKPETADKLKQQEERTYYLLALLAMMRQSLAHNNADLYKLEPENDKSNSSSRVAARDALDSIYNSSIERLNNGFLKNSAKNLTILFNVLECKTAEQKKRVAQDYYDYAVRKSYKNMGFSIKNLREKILNIGDAQYLREETYNSVRSKMYNLFDFILYERYTGSEQKAADELVAKLRAADNEVDKQLCYVDEANRIWKVVGSIVKSGLIVKMSGRYIKDLKSADVPHDVLNGVMLKTDATYFSKLVFLMTNFLDGKEINDLLTTLINKFENIQSFISVLKGCGMPVKFAKDYRLLEKSGEIAGELRIINSFARMTKVSQHVKQEMYVDAAHVLGYNKSENELIAELNEELNKNKKDKSFRNFIAGNVLESRRFRYLMRYTNATNVRDMASNGKIISFVLNDIPDTMIDRYYTSISGDKKRNCADERAYLSRRITGFKLDEVRDVRQNKRYATIQDKVEKEKKKAVVGLYLTVLYLFTKNLVYVNSRYFLAFHCVERDAAVFDRVKYMGKAVKADWSGFAREFLTLYPGKKRVRDYLTVNINNSDQWAINAFRNKVDHLDAVKNAGKYLIDVGEFKSYFELYHYIMQRTIRDQYTWDRSKFEVALGGNTEYYLNFVAKYHNYNKDFVKALCVPFAYNLPRFKNLSIEGLFDMNRPGGDDTKEQTE